MTNKARTPIAVFTYNRPDHTRRMLESLAGCARLDECQVFIFSDGPRLQEHTQAVQNVREIIHDWGRIHEARIIEQKENKGLINSIVDGVTQLCNEYGRVIVIEDDLILHPAFLNYMITALNFYEGEPRVAQIAGYMFPVSHPTPPDVFFLPLTSSWGWATWKRSWDLFNLNPRGAREALSDKKISRQFSLENSYPYPEMLEQRLEGKNQAWDVLLYWAYFSNHKFVLYPAESLVSNAGMDGSGYHFNDQNAKTSYLYTNLSDWTSDHSFEFPSSISVGEIPYQRIQNFIRSHQSGGGLIHDGLSKIKTRIKSLLRGRARNRT